MIASCCRKILAQLSARPEADGNAPFSRVGLSAAIEAAAAAYRRDPVTLVLEAADLEGNPPGGEEPTLPHTPELMHGLANILQNAIQFARETVEVRLYWDDEIILVEIQDDGPGFPPTLLDSLGEPYLSGRARRDGHMGLGIFIAKTLLGRTGAMVDFTNAGEEGGARVTLRWPRTHIG